MRRAKATLRVARVFLDAPDTPRYGYDLWKQAHIGSGTLYPILARFEREGWLTSSWEVLDEATAQRRPRRRNYTVTEAGRTALRQLTEDRDARTV